MSQMTGSVQQSAEHAQLARGLAARASDVARRGGDAVQRVVQTMGDIQDTSHRIAAISQLIDDFASQTNILALNAAVEAARAGPSGQGFTVVAAEVGRLAQRSAAAAHEIRDLVETSTGKVSAGGQLAADAGATMTDIVAQVQHVQDLIDQIGQAASEQTMGIGTVSGSVTSLDQSTQQNAALVEQSAAAARMLRDQAHRLAGTVAGFRLEMA
jgi:methyl-accepting chemotaxis protein